MARDRAFFTAVVAGAALSSLTAGCSLDDPTEAVGRVGQSAPGLARISEILVNPPGTDDGAEYVEFRGTAGASLEDVYLVVLDGSGDVTLFVDLADACGSNPCEFGSNGLLFIGDPDTYDDVPGDTTVVDGTDIDDSEVLENDAALVVLFERTDGISGSPDAWDDLPGDMVILDAVGFAEGPGTDVFGDVDLEAGFEPRGITRLPGDDTASSVDAWYYGDVEEGDGGTLEYVTSGDISDNAPDDAVMTPGELNGPEDEPVGAGGAGGSSSTGGGGVPAAGAPAGVGAPAADGGASGAPGSAGAPSSATGGDGPGAAGTPGSGGTPDQSGSSGQGPGAADALPTTGGSGADGPTATGGSPAASTGGSPATGGRVPYGTEEYKADDDGCGCRAVGQHSGRSTGLAAVLLLAAALWARRRQPRR